MTEVAPRRVAIVTGGTRGLGAAITRNLVEGETHVVAVFRSDAEAAARYAESFASPSAVSVHQLDVGDRNACHRLVERVLADHGRIDHLVNNAGVLVEQTLQDLSAEHWDTSMRVNLSAAFHLSAAVMPAMREQRFGRIVNIGSITASMGSAFQIDYAAAKAGLIGLTRSLARSSARRGITVNCVVPGGFQTDLLDAMTLSDSEAIETSVPVGRYGLPHELAHIVAAILHDDASYVTGAVIVVDGGMSMGG